MQQNRVSFFQRGNHSCNGSAIVECETRDSAPNRTDRTPLCSRSPHLFFSFPSSSLTSRIPILVLVRLFSPSTFPDRSQTIPIYDKADVPSFHSATTTLLSSTLLTSAPSIDSISDSRSSLDGLAFVAPHVLGTVHVNMTISVTTRSVLAIPRTLDFVISCHSHRYIFHYSESFV